MAASKYLPMVGSLDEYVVVELGCRLSAAICGSVLSELGTTVVNIEGVGTAKHPSHKGAYREQLSLGKHSFAPDFACEADHELLRELLARADAVLISSDMDPDVVSTFAKVVEDYAVTCDVTAFGSSGPLSGLSATEYQVQALSGLIHLTGLPAKPPTPIAIPVAEFMCGIYAAATTIAALRFRRLRGLSQRAEVSLYDCAFAATASFLPKVFTAEAGQKVHRVGNRHVLCAPWNVYAACDGWIMICTGSDLQWTRLCTLMGKVELSAAPELATLEGRVQHVDQVDAYVQDWISGLQMDACLQKLDSASIPCAPITQINGFPREQNLIHRKMIREIVDERTGRKIFCPGSPFAMSVTPGHEATGVSELDGGRARVRAIVVGATRANRRQVDEATSGADRPLSGLRVIEIGHYTTVPLCARHLASLGAEVIKVEPLEGEATRNWKPAKLGQSLFFISTNANKHSLALDLRRQEDANILAQLITSSDVLVENLKPGSLSKLGFGPDVVAALNARLVYCSVSGFGLDTIYAGRPAFDTVIQAASGLMHLIQSNGTPVKAGISYSDLLGAAAATAAILAALEHRDRFGRGQHIDLSMQDITAWTTRAAWNGRRESDPVQLVQCVDGYVVIEQEQVPVAMSASQAAMSRQELASDLGQNGIHAAAVMTLEEVLDAPQTTERQLVLSLKAEGEQVPVVAPPFRLSGTPVILSRPGPLLGADRARILSEIAATGTGERQWERGHDC